MRQVQNLSSLDMRNPLWRPGSVSTMYRPLYQRRTVLTSNEKAICCREHSMKNASTTLRDTRLLSPRFWLPPSGR